MDASRRFIVRHCQSQDLDPADYRPASRSRSRHPSLKMPRPQTFLPITRARQYSSLTNEIVDPQALRQEPAAKSFSIAIHQDLQHIKEQHDDICKKHQGSRHMLIHTEVMNYIRGIVEDIATHQRDH